jgi:hypothetical protein
MVPQVLAELAVEVDDMASQVVLPALGANSRILLREDIGKQPQSRKGAWEKM